MMSIARRDVMVGGLSMAMLLSRSALAASAAPPAIYGATMTVEIAPVLLTVRDRYPVGTAVQLGGVASLIEPNAVADVATNAETQLLRQSVKRPDLRIIMTLVEGRYRLVARRSAGIASLADLKGKRVGTLRATSAEYFLARMLDSAGLAMNDVTIVQVGPLKNLAPAIAKQEIDAVAIWEPFSEDAVRALGDDAVTFSGEGIYRELFNLNTTAGALADRGKRRQIVSLMTAIIDTTDAMNANPAVAAQAQALVARSGGYTAAQIADAWPHHGFVAAFEDDMLDVLAEEEIWLAHAGKRPPRPRAQLARLIDRSAYDEALALSRRG